MGYDGTSDNRVADVETKAIDGDPYHTRHLKVDRSYSPSHTTDDNNNDFTDSQLDSALHGASGRHQGRGRGNNNQNSASRNFNRQLHTSRNGMNSRHSDDPRARHTELSSHFKRGDDLRRSENGHSKGRGKGDRHGTYEIKNHRPTLSYDDEGDESGHRRHHRRSLSRSRSQSRSRSPYRASQGRDRSRSPFRHDRSRSPYRRDRSRSPFRHNRTGPRERGDGARGKPSDENNRSSKKQGRNKEGARRNEATGTSGRKVRFDQEQADITERIEIEIESQKGTSKVDEDARIEARRRRNAEIRAKLGAAESKDSPTHPDSTHGAQNLAIPTADDVDMEQEPSAAQVTSTSKETVKNHSKGAPSTHQPVLAASTILADAIDTNPPEQVLSRDTSVGPDTADASPSTQAANDAFEVEDIAAPEEQDDFASINELGDHRRSDSNTGATGAVDYDEMMMQDDDRLKRLNLRSQAVNKQEPAKHQIEDEDEDFDMFSDSPAPETTRKVAKTSEKTKLDASLLVDDIDDEEGYLKFRTGEILDNRYQVTEVLGKGMFANVLRAKDISSGNRVVAVKLLRNNAAMRKAGAVEIRLLQKLNEEDSKDRMHIVRFFGLFDYKNHLCMVFENLNMNLRDVLKKFGRDAGLNIGALRSFSFQMFKALHHLKACQIIHADLKPDNILITQDMKTIKICDLGTAADFREPIELSSYVASRFYRAPEVVLGMKYDYGIDMWAIGCTLYELYTGKILFTGRSNNQMLKMMMECKGHFSMKFLKKGEFSGKNFNDNGTFHSIEADPKTHQEVVREISQIKVERGRDIPSRIKSAADPGDKNEVKEAELFGDLVDRCLMVVPDRRLSPEQALKHDFIHRPAKNVPQPKFTPTALIGGAKQHQSKPSRKRAIATDFMHEESVNSPTSMASPLSPAHTPRLGFAEQVPVATQAPPKKKGFKRVKMVEL